MKKISVKKVLICLSIIFFLVWGLFIYAVDVIKIDPLKFISSMRIQQINLYYRLNNKDNGLDVNDIVRAWLKNQWGNDMGVLYIRQVDATNSFVDETNNSIAHPDEASIIWGHENTNLWYESTMILWWSRNTAEWTWVTLMWWDNNTALVDNAVILWSSDATVWAPNWVVIASNGWTVNWKNSTLLWWKGTITENAEYSFWIGMWDKQIEQKWVFVAWGVNVLKPNIVALNIWQWLIVNWMKQNGNSKVQLSVNGAIAVGQSKNCNEDMAWSIYYVPAVTKGSQPKPAYCLCSCVASWSNYTSMALSNQPYCDGICNWWDWTPPDCWTRWLKNWHRVFENLEKDWRVASNYCRDNTMPISYTRYKKDKDWKKVDIRSCTNGLDERCIENPNLEWCACDPSFMSTGEYLEWTCKWIWIDDRVECGAYRKVASPNNAVCWENANKYVLSASWFLSAWASGFCHWWDPSHPENRSENAVPIAIKVLSEKDVKDWVAWSYVTSSNIKDYGSILRELNNNFILTWGRTYWQCATTNLDNESFTWAEVVSVQDCFAERMPCNYCGKSGFPYCFDVDFDEKCDEWVGASCVPWEDNHGQFHPLYALWDSTYYDDSIFAITNLTTGDIKNDWINDVKFYEYSNNPWHWYVRFTFNKNNDKSVRTWTVHFETADKAFCSSWDVYIVQCGSWQILDASHHSCINNQWIIEYDCNFWNWTMANQVFVVWDDNGTLTGNKCSRENFDFLGWSESSSATSATYVDKAKFTFSEAKKIVLYAVWKQKVVTVTFHANWWDWWEWGILSQTLNAGTPIHLSTNGFEKEWYTFNGWNTKPDGSWTPYTNGQSITITSDLDLYAMWKENEIVKHTVTFDANWWTLLTSDSVSVSDNTVLDLSIYMSSKPWYDFIWWNTSSTATTAMSNPTITKDIKLYAIYEKEKEQEPDCKYTEWVTYGIDSITVSSCNESKVIDIKDVGAYSKWYRGEKYSWADEPELLYGTLEYDESTVKEPWSNIIGLCREWYHVPSDDEWRNLVSIWNDISETKRNSYDGTTFREKFLNALYLSSEGTEWYDVWGWNQYQAWVSRKNPRLWGYYWTNHENWGDYLYDWVWIFDTDNIDPYDGADYRNKFYVRCFKDDEYTNYSTDYCHTKWVHHVWDEIIVSNGSTCMRVADKNVWATHLGGVWNYYMWWAPDESRVYPNWPIGSEVDCDDGLYLNCHWWWGWSHSPCEDIWKVPDKQDWLRIYEIWSESNSSKTFWDDLELPYVWYYYENERIDNGIWYYWTDESWNWAEAWWMVMNWSAVQFQKNLQGHFYWLQLRCFK